MGGGTALRALSCFFQFKEMGGGSAIQTHI